MTQLAHAVCVHGAAVLLASLLCAGCGGGGGGTATSSSTLAVASTTPLPDARDGAPYTLALAANGAVGSTTWAVESGSLPLGVSLAANGTLSGTPSGVGDFSFVVRVADDLGSVSGQLALRVTSDDAAFEAGQGAGGTTSGALAWGTATGSFNGVTAFSNQIHAVNVGGDASRSLYGTYGYQYQCVEFANRYYVDALGHRNMRGGGHAYVYFTTASAKGLEAHPNGGSVPPEVSDILCFDNPNAGARNRFGHVAIVREVTATGIRVIQQNWFNNTNDANMPLALTQSAGTYTVADPNASYHVQGWLRIPGSGPTTGTITPATTSTLATVSRPAYALLKSSTAAYVSKRGTFSTTPPILGEIVEVNLSTGAETLLASGFKYPGQLALKGNLLYCVVTGEHTVVSVDVVTHAVAVVAGSPNTPGFGGDGGPATSALLDTPSGILVDGSDVIVADQHNHRVRRIDSTGEINTIAGTGGSSSSGDGGDPLLAQLAYPQTLASIHAGVYYVASSEKIRRIDLNTNRIDFVVAHNTKLDGLAFTSGDLVFTSINDHTILRVQGSSVTLIAGVANQSGDVDGAPLTARFFEPWGIAYDAGTDSFIVCDHRNSKLRRVPN